MQEEIEGHTGCGVSVLSLNLFSSQLAQGNWVARLLSTYASAGGALMCALALDVEDNAVGGGRLHLELGWSR